MLRISNNISIPLREIEISQIHSSGPGGQNVNKVASAVHLRFNIAISSLPDACKQRLLSSSDNRLTKDGELIIKAQRYRSFEKNRQDALDRLALIIVGSLKQKKKRSPTKPTQASRRKRLEQKTKCGMKKALRKKVTYHD